MEIIFLYGPPGAGKLTVAKELANITGYKIFHNHLVADLVHAFFTLFSKKSFTYNEKTKIQFINIAAKEGIKGIVMTFCYAHNDDDGYIKRLMSKTKKNNVSFHFVHLVCEEKELKKRISHASRKKYAKLRCKKELGEALKKWEFYKPVPFVESYTIDNTNTPAKKVAQKIKRYYKIKKVT